MSPYENEVKLIDCVDALWRKRWMVIVSTAAFVIIAGFICMSLPRKWEVDAIIQPGKILAESEQGTLVEVFFANPTQIVSEINQESFNERIAAELKIAPNKMPKIKAEHLRDTKMLRVSLRSHNPESDMAILSLLFSIVKDEIDKKTSIEMKNIDTKIKAQENSAHSKKSEIVEKEINIETSRQEISSVGKRFEISQALSARLLDELKSVRAKNDEIENLQKAALSEKKETGESLGLLLYSNEIQQNLRFLSILEQKQSELRDTQENLLMFMREKEQTIKILKNDIEKIKIEIVKIENEIELLIGKKSRIDFTLLLKKPTVSLRPVYPKRARVVVFCALFGFGLSVVIALFLDYVEKQHRKR